MSSNRSKGLESLIRELRADFLDRIAWQSWAPTVTQGVAVTATITFARYIVLANIALMQVKLSITSAGTGGNAIVIAGIPSAIQPANSGDSVVIGSALIKNTATAFYAGSLVANGVDDFRILTDNVADFAGIDPNFSLANSDIISFMAIYER